MKTFFVTISVFVLSLLIAAKLFRYIIKRQKLYSFLLKHQTVIVIGVTLCVVLVPLLLLSMSNDHVALGSLTGVFLISLLISLLLGILAERIRVLIFHRLSRTEKTRPDFETTMPVHNSAESDWRLAIEQKTLERFGLDSNVGISSDTIDRLANTLIVSLGQEIDSLEIDQDPQGRGDELRNE